MLIGSQEVLSLQLNLKPNAQRVMPLLESLQLRVFIGLKTTTFKSFRTNKSSTALALLTTTDAEEGVWKILTVMQLTIHWSWEFPILIMDPKGNAKIINKEHSKLMVSGRLIMAIAMLLRISCKINQFQCMWMLQTLTITIQAYSATVGVLPIWTSSWWDPPIDTGDWRTAGDPTGERVGTFGCPKETFAEFAQCLPTLSMDGESLKNDLNFADIHNPIYNLHQFLKVSSNCSIITIIWNRPWQNCLSSKHINNSSSLLKI